MFWECLSLQGAGLLLAGAAALLRSAAWTWATVALVGVAGAAFALYTSVVIRNPPSRGPTVGESLPAFRLPDQAGRSRTLPDLCGRRGLYLVTIRGHW